ncbi:MAG: glycine cleavage system protein R [Proteobacteria bacterium]|nr:glycine cleavage system protein R [Pseudomonadota bacterium]
MTSGSTNLVISVLGQDRPGIIDQLAKVAVDNHCSIQDSRMTVLGGEFALIQLVSGDSDHINSLESRLPALADELGLSINSRQTLSRTNINDQLPYHVDVIAMDHPGIVQTVAAFFSSRGINIEEMNTGSYAAAHTGTPMFSLEMSVAIPATTSVSSLKHEFTDFCDELNLDGNLEPEL